MMFDESSRKCSIVINRNCLGIPPGKSKAVVGLFRRAFDEESHGTRRAATPAQLDAFFNRDPDFRDTPMHHSRLCAVLIDCKTREVDEAANFWSHALGRAVDPAHPGSRGNYLMLETPPDEPIVQIQGVDHESRVHIDIETDDIPAEVARLEKTLLRRACPASRIPKKRQSLGLNSS
jgi:hypothetical protein